MTDWREYRDRHTKASALSHPVIGARTGNSEGTSLVNNCAAASQAKKLSAKAGQGSFTHNYLKRLEPYYEHVPHGTAVKPTQRPVSAGNKSNADSIERQEAADLHAFTARAHRYRQHMPQPYHHHHKPAVLSSNGHPEDHVYPDRGRRKPDWCRCSSIFDPITSSSKPTGVAGRTDMRPSSAPHQRPRTADGCSQLDNATAAAAQQQQQPATPRRPGTARDLQGRYNPITHDWLQQPDPTAQAARQKTSDRIHGFIGLRTGNNLVKSELPLGSSQQQQQSADAGSSSEGDKRRRAANAPRAILSGETWGTYDPLCHQWIVPPADQRFVSKEAAPDGLKFNRPAGASRNKVAMAASQGVYDPIKCEWKVLPQNDRVKARLEFAPRMFTKQCFVPQR